MRAWNETAGPAPAGRHPLEDQLLSALAPGRSPTQSPVLVKLRVSGSGHEALGLPAHEAPGASGRAKVVARARVFAVTGHPRTRVGFERAGLAGHAQYPSLSALRGTARWT